MKPYLRCVRQGWMLLLCATVLRGQSGGQPGAPAGLESQWDVRKIIGDLQKDAAQLEPMLAQLKPQEWVDKKGAPSTFIVQWQSAQQQLRDAMTVTKLFAQKTESLPLAMDAYFRLEALEVTERSLVEGARAYDNRATADKLNGMVARNFTNRDRLREYVRNLATSSEETCRIADQEAQRCRGQLSQQPKRGK